MMKWLKLCCLLSAVLTFGCSSPAPPPMAPDEEPTEMEVDTSVELGLSNDSGNSGESKL